MSLGSRYGDQLLSPDIRIRWAGWEARAYDLQRNGWDFHVDYSPQYYSYRMAMSNERAHMYGVSNHIGAETLEEGGHRILERFPLVEIALMGKDIYFNVTQPMNFQAVDMTPTPVDYGTYRKHISEFGVFKLKEQKVITEEPKRIILPDEYSVDELLDVILKKQEPDRQKYMEEQVKANPEKVRTEAEIIRFPNAA